MTEEDTFNRLKRTPFKDMVQIFFKMARDAPMPRIKDQELLKEHGWTESAFWNEYNDVFKD